MIVLSDTSRINYLVLIGQVEVLPQLFGEVLEAAGKRGFLDLPTAIAKLRQTNFHIAERIIQRVLNEDAHRRAQGS